MDIFKIFLDEDYSLNIVCHRILTIAIAAILIYLILRLLNTKGYFYKNVEIDSAEIGLGSHKVKIKPNHTNIQIAYKIWVELNTRKIGIPIDFEHDNLVEIYDSWYKFFGVTRELIKELPASKIRHDKDTQQLISISTKILNDGLRPHLTKWQAKFRKWFDGQCNIDNDHCKSPQIIQKNYPEYDLLKDDMQKININLICYKNMVYKLAFGKDR